MSRIGKTPIKIPSGVNLTLNQNLVKATGVKGELTLSLPDFLSVKLENNQLILALDSKYPKYNNQYGLYRALLQNIVTGVSVGWEKTLELVGVGYKAQGGGNEVILNVGFTHPVKFTAPKNITFKIIDNNQITVSGIDKKTVGEIASQIRRIKKPEPYKGKGIRYLGEIVRKKAGKAVKAAGAAA